MADYQSAYTGQEIDSGIAKANSALQSISSSDVTTALGYTPYNSTNPNGYITNTDYATSSVGGVLKVSNGDYGMAVDSGVLKGAVRTLAQYNSMSSKGIVCKGTLENVLDDKIGDIETILTRLTTGGGVS